jgi:hypothetical protein
MNKRSRLIRGWGVNDADYTTCGKTNGVGHPCPIYVKWASMLNRVHNPAYKALQPTYEDVVIDDSWKYFSNFKAWVDTQVAWDGMHLDKDILVLGNKSYGPSMCCFVPQWLIIYSAQLTGLMDQICRWVWSLKRIT